MFDRHYIGRSSGKIAVGRQTAPYTRVVVTDSEGREHTAGDDTGQTLTVSLPWGDAAAAQRILAKFIGLRYQPYTADNALLPPEAGLGDIFSSADVKGPILHQVSEYSPLMPTSVSSPANDELEQEYPYVSKIQRESRRMSGAINGLGRTVGGLSQQMEDQKGFNLDMTGRYNTLSGGLQSVGKELDDYKAVTTNVFARIDDDIGLVESSLVQTAARVGNVETANTQLASRVDGAEASLTLTSSRVNGLSQSVATLQADFVNINGTVVKLNNVFAVTDVAITALRQLIATDGFQIGKNYFYVASKKYEPQTITSTSGQVTVLGY